MNIDIFTHEDEGIDIVYDNQKWIVAIKNWKPDNDMTGIHRLEVHHATDEQFILMAGDAILLTADFAEDHFENIELEKMEIGKVYNVPQGKWFYSITKRNSKMAYIQDSGTSLDNSEYFELNQQELEIIKARATELFA